MKKFNLDEIFSNKKFTIIISVIIAIIAWFITVMVNDSSGVVTIHNVPITCDTKNTQAEQLSLEAVNIEPKTVSVTIRGPKYKIGLISNKDIVVSPTSMINVTSEGTYAIDLVANLKQPQRDVFIDEIEPKFASVSFDSISTKTVSLIADTPNIKVDPGYVSDKAVCQPEKLFVSGPKQVIDKLDYIKLVVDSSADLNISKTFEATPKFISIDGFEMEPGLFKYNEDIKFIVSVPVYKEKQIPLKFIYKNASNHFNTDLLNAIISPENIDIAGAPDIIDSISEINLGYIDMRELDIGKSFIFTVKVPSGYKNIDRIDAATVSFDSSKWKSRNFSVSDVKLSNVPSDYDVNINSSVIKDVKFVGFVDAIDNLNVSDITATVDLTNVSIKEGKQIVPVTVETINKDGVWAVGEYKCSITATKK